MKKDTLTLKLLTIGLTGFACFVASLFVFNLVSERENRHNDVKSEIGQTWGAPQTFIGPLLVFKKANAHDTYVLPETLHIVTEVRPEIRRRGIFETVIYTEYLKVSGTFSQSDIAQVKEASNTGILTASISDTRSIEKQILLKWGTQDISFSPGSNASLLKESGVHAPVTFSNEQVEYPFSFELALNGNEKLMFAPVGKETDVTMTSSWNTPEFTGAFLPSEREITPDSFTATWKVSSFGRSYAQIFHHDESVTFETLLDSTFGVNLHEGIDLYTQVSRSAKYAILFIAVTFIVFFLFEILSNVRLHSIQYLLIGLALSLFYLLLLSLSEHIGFLKAYVIATTMTSLLISAYSTKVLIKKSRAISIFALLSLLYGYLYFILNLEDYALLFGSLLLFCLLASVMYLTRNIEWTNVGTDNPDNCLT